MNFLKTAAALIFVSYCTVGFGAIDPNIKVMGVEKVSSTFRDVVKTIKPAVVYIEVLKQGTPNLYGAAVRGSGSGVIIDGKRGYVLTAYHVIENVTRVKVKLADGNEYEASDIRGDSHTDLAIVKIDAGVLPEANLGDSETMEVGDWVLAIGSPFGAALENSVSAGIISAKGRRTNVLGKMGIEDYIQTDAVINKGNSGGPLVNIRGQVIGINSNIISTTGMYAGLGFAVPSNMVKPVATRLISEGKVVRGWLGVVIASLSEMKATVGEGMGAGTGAYVVDTISGGPGYASGLRKGDIILSVDGKEVKDSFELINDVCWKRPGEIANCTVLRKGSHVDIPVVLGERPNADLSEKPKIEEVGGEIGAKKLGIMVADLDVKIQQNGGTSRVKAAIVMKVDKGSLAQQSNIEVGDIVTKVNETPVENAKDFERLVKTSSLAQGISITILSAIGERTVMVKAEE